MRLKGSLILLALLLVVVMVVGPANAYEQITIYATEDGRMTNGNLTTFSIKITDVGTAVFRGTTGNAVGLKATENASEFLNNHRLGFIFPTGDAMAPNSTYAIGGATVYLYPNGTTAAARAGNTFSTPGGFSLIGFLPADNTTIAASDYQTNKTVKLSDTTRTITGAQQAGYQEFPLNPAGIATIERGAGQYTDLMVVVNWTADSVSPTWESGGAIFWNINQSESEGTATDPKIVLDIITPPTAAFSGTPVYGTAPLAVTFTDASTDNVTSWLWDFGDGETSTSQNPSHTFAGPGNYTISLTATNAAGSDGETKADYIKVATAPAACPMDLTAMYNITGVALDTGLGNSSDASASLNQAFAYADNQSSCKISFPKDRIVSLEHQILMPRNAELNGQNATLKIPTGWNDDTYTGGKAIIYTGENDWWHNLNFNGNYPGGAIEDVNQNILINDWVIMEDSNFWNVSHYNVFSFGDSNWVFRNNRVENVSQYGIATQRTGDGVWSDNITITGNTFIGCRQVGIKLRGASNATVSFNKVYNLQTDPPTTDSYGQGVRLYTADNDDYYVNVTSNIIDGFMTGDYWVGLESDSTGNHTHCTFFNNTVNGSAWGISTGSIGPDSGVLVVGNVVRNSSRSSAFVTGHNHTFENNVFDDGILLGNPPFYKTMSNITIRRNIITDGIAYTTSNTGKGIGFAAFITNTIIDFNTIIISSLTTYDISISSTYGIANYTSVTNNNLTAPGGSSYCHYDTGNFTIFGNNTCNGAMDPLIVKFTGTQTVPSVGKKQVVFTDTSTGPTILSRIWTATEIVNSTPVEIGTTTPLTVTFGPGNYSIVLNASGAIEANSTAENAYWVNVSASDSSSVPIAAFSANATTVCYGATVAFTDQSTNTSSWAWVFGDGATSTTQNPEHTYNISSGYFTVALTASNGIGSDTETKTNYIEVQGGCSGGDTTPSTHPFSAATGSSMITTALGILGLALIGFGAAIVIGAFTTQSTDGLIAGIFTIMLGGAILIISYMFLSPIMNLVV